MGKLVIDGNSVYEIDESCIQRKENQKKRQEEERERKDEKKSRSQIPSSKLRGMI